MQRGLGRTAPLLGPSTALDAPSPPPRSFPPSPQPSVYLAGRGGQGQEGSREQEGRGVGRPARALSAWLDQRRASPELSSRSPDCPPACSPLCLLPAPSSDRSLRCPTHHPITPLASSPPLFAAAMRTRAAPRRPIPALSCALQATGWLVTSCNRLFGTAFRL